MTKLPFVRSLSLLTVLGTMGAPTVAWASGEAGYESLNALNSVPARWQLTEGLFSGGVGVRAYHAHHAVGRAGHAPLADGLPTPIRQTVYRWSPRTDLFFAYDNRAGMLRADNVSLNASRYRIALGLSMLPSSSDYVEVGTAVGISRHVSATAALFHNNVTWRAEVSGPGSGLYRMSDIAQRTGLSFGIQGQWFNGIGMRLNYSFAHASHASGSCVGICSPDKLLSYQRSPDAPEQSMYGELSWQHAKFGISAAIGARYIGNTSIEDSESLHDGVARYVAANAKLNAEQRFGRWRIQEFARFENVAFREFKGASYDVNFDHRYPESAPERSYSVGITAGYSW